jgi:AcrR family transcriptional regulator
MATDRKTEILQAAQRLFRKQGYAVASMRDIASDMQMEAASLYNHIDSKEEILNITCFNLAEKLNSGLEEINDIYFNAEEKLRTAVKMHVKTLTEDLNAAYVFIHDWRNLSEPKLSQFISHRNLYEKGFTTILEEGEKEGAFKEVDNKFAVLTILSSLNWIVEWYKADGKMSPEEIATKLSDFILSGLSKEFRF